MTIKEKFKNILFVYEIALDESKIDRCEKLTDELVIGFAEWLGENEFTMLYKNHWYSEFGGSFTTKELLEIYKKEKAL